MTETTPGAHPHGLMEAASARWSVWPRIQCPLVGKSPVRHPTDTMTMRSGISGLRLRILIGVIAVVVPGWIAFFGSSFLWQDATFQIIDNSWATGQIFFHRTATDAPVEKDSKNGHAVAAVHWPTGRLAVSGTEQNLLLFSTTGQRLARRPLATSERTYAVAFSPSGQKIATLDQHGSIGVFSIH